MTARRLSGALALALLVSLWLLELALTSSRVFQANMGHDFSTMYCAALAWLHGASPYTSAAPRMLAQRLHVPFIYVIDTPATLLLYAPFTLFPARLAVLLFAVLSCAAAALAGYIAASFLPRQGRVLIALAFLASPAVFLAYYVGQTAAYLALLAAAMLWARRTDRYVLLGALGATICALKPQLGLCVALPLLWGLSRRAWAGALVSGGLWLAVFALVLTPAGVLPYVAHLRWFGAHAVAHDAYDGLGAVSLYVSWAPAALRSALTALTVLAVLAAVVLLVKRVGARPRARHLAAATALATLLLPYSHSYDTVVLYPALLLCWHGIRERADAVLLTVATILLAAAPLIALFAPQTPYRLVPFGLLLLAAPALLRTSGGQDCATVQ